MKPRGQWRRAGGPVDKYGCAEGPGHRRPDVEEGAEASRRKQGITRNVETVAPFREIIDEIKEAGGEAFKYCYQCGKCDVVCPWNRVRSFSIRKIVREATFGLTEIEMRGHLALHDLRHLPSASARGASSRSRSGVAMRRIATEYGVFRPCGRRSPRRGQPAQPTAIRSGTGTRRSGRTGPRAWRSSRSPRGWSCSTSSAATTATTRRLKKVARPRPSILEKAGVDFGILGHRGELLRREHPQDGQRGAVQDAWPGRTSRPSSTTG